MTRHDPPRPAMTRHDMQTRPQPVRAVTAHDDPALPVPVIYHVHVPISVPMSRPEVGTPSRTRNHHQTLTANTPAELEPVPASPAAHPSVDPLPLLIPVPAPFQAVRCKQATTAPYPLRFHFNPSPHRAPTHSLTPILPHS